MTGAYRSPVTGAALATEGEHLLRDVDGRLWPVLDGIPFLRIGREPLAAEAVALLQAGDHEAALVALLADQDDWWTGDKPNLADLRRLVRARARLGLREAMACLAFDRVGDYFAHRWSDPTFLAGLALIDAHWREPTRTAFELACGIGHYGRALTRRGVAFTGGDVVFAKLWLARHWVLPPAADLVCFDAAAPSPVAGRRFDLALCHDAFYFLEPKRLIRDRLRALAEPAGRVAISHIHNRSAANLSAGHAVSLDEMADLFPGATIYDDAELTEAHAAGRPPRAAGLGSLGGVEAFSVVVNPAEAIGTEASSEALVQSSHPPHAEQPAKLAGRSAQGDRASFDTPPPAAQDEGSGRIESPSENKASGFLRLNPLYAERPAGWQIAWPSARYEAEYAPRATYPTMLHRDAVERLQVALKVGDPADPALAEAVRCGILVDLPERW